MSHAPKASPLFALAVGAAIAMTGVTAQGCSLTLGDTSGTSLAASRRARHRAAAHAKAARRVSKAKAHQRELQAAFKAGVAAGHRDNRVHDAADIPRRPHNGSRAGGKHGGVDQGGKWRATQEQHARKPGGARGNRGHGNGKRVSRSQRECVSPRSGRPANNC